MIWIFIERFCNAKEDTVEKLTTIQAMSFVKTAIALHRNSVYENPAEMG